MRYFNCLCLFLLFGFQTNGVSAASLSDKLGNADLLQNNGQTTQAIHRAILNFTNENIDIFLGKSLSGTATVLADMGISLLGVNILMAVVVAILLAILGILLILVAGIKSYLETSANLTEEQRNEMNKPDFITGVVRSPAFIFAVVFLVVSGGFKTTIDALFTIGVQKGYQPTQPIAFSHKIHAGQYGIDCKYCHTGALRGKQANIPSPNICMNCHKQISEGTNTGKTEIAKIYAAVGYDPGTAAYTGETKPIEWVRIHNLPDLAYFNHSQHVKVGGLECQTCHGPIEEMDIVKQHSLLTMGWCIDCHRKTDVNTKGNAYYDNLLRMHQQIKGQNASMKVQDIGGLECAKCHY